MNNQQQEEQQYEDYYRPNMFERPEDISRHLLEVEKNKAGVINLDSSRANLNPHELMTVRAIGSLLNEIIYVEKMTTWRFTDLKDHLRNEIALTNVPSRAKHGWAAALSKTDRRINVSDTQEMAGDISDEFDDKTKQGLMDKLSNAVPLLRKKEM
jgi:hypothetical protein